MREHGVLKRILLVYGEALRRMDANEDLPPEPLADSARIIREFVENYHERLEENFLFPRFSASIFRSFRWTTRLSSCALVRLIRSLPRAHPLGFVYVARLPPAPFPPRLSS